MSIVPAFLNGTPQRGEMICRRRDQMNIPPHWGEESWGECCPINMTSLRDGRSRCLPPPWVVLSWTLRLGQLRSMTTMKKCRACSSNGLTVS